MTFFFSRRAVCREQELFDLCGLPHWGSNPKVDSGPRLLESDPGLSVPGRLPKVCFHDLLSVLPLRRYRGTLSSASRALSMHTSPAMSSGMCQDCPSRCLTLDRLSFPYKYRSTVRSNLEIRHRKRLITTNNKT